MQFCVLNCSMSHLNMKKHIYIYFVVVDASLKYSYNTLVNISHLSHKLDGASNFTKANKKTHCLISPSLQATLAANYTESSFVTRKCAWHSLVRCLAMVMLRDGTAM